MGTLERRPLIAIAIGISLVGLLALCSGSARASARACPTVVKPARFDSARTLRRLDAAEASFGARPTGSENQASFIRWIDRRLKHIKGLKRKSLSYSINRWQERSTAITTGGQALPVAGPIPYSKPTGPAGVAAPVSYVGPGEAITSTNAAGKIVAVEDPPSVVPYSAFFSGVLGVQGYAPSGLDPNAPYVGEARVEAGYLRAAQAAGAVGLVIVKDLPLDQIRGFYRPYGGIAWTIPGAYVGADEGLRLKQEAAASGEATLSVDASFVPTATRTLLARLKGRGRHPATVLVESHTDGMNALWDNGPVAMIAMARYFADLPRRCRPRTIEFAFTTGHLYGGLGSEDLARRLDTQYDRGRVAGVLTLEHMGARQYATVTRTDGPGSRLERTDTHELTIVATTQSAALRSAVASAIRRARLDRTALVVGTDVPQPSRVPPNCNFGGEGTAYDRVLLPTVGEISGPRELFTPGYGLEAIDFPFMRRQTLAFTNLTLRLSRMRLRAIAGDLVGMRQARAAGAPGCTGGMSG
jgi:hypothetical protein